MLLKGEFPTFRLSDRDGDGDGFVDDGTNAERPVDEVDDNSSETLTRVDRRELSFLADSAVDSLESWIGISPEEYAAMDVGARTDTVLQNIDKFLEPQLEALQGELETDEFNLVSTSLGKTGAFQLLSDMVRKQIDSGFKS